MQMEEDRELLRRYAVDGSESAFAELVERHVKLVYSAALRQVEGDAHLAQDVTQSIFLDLARKSARLTRHNSLAGWLYTSVRFAAATARRTVRRRRERERQAQVTSEPDVEPRIEAQWDVLQAVLDQAMHRLKEKDRHAVLLRYFEGKTLAQVGSALGLTEEAARKRIDRALDKLRATLEHRGAVVSGSALAAILGDKTAVAIPAGLTVALTSAAMASGATGASLPVLTFIAMTKLKITAALIVAGLATLVVYERQTNTKLRDENRVLREQVVQIEELRAENQRLSRAGSSAANGLSEQQSRELLRLRGQVGVLRRQLSEYGKGAGNAPSAPQPDSWNDWTDQAAQEQAMAKMGYGKHLALALILFADKHQGQFPTNFNMAASFIPAESKAQTNLVPDQFELLYQGVYDDMTNSAEAIVVREKQAWIDPKGQWARVYGFADGHSEIRVEPNGHFEAWEAEHQPRIKER